MLICVLVCRHTEDMEEGDVEEAPTFVRGFRRMKKKGRRRQQAFPDPDWAEDFKVYLRRAQIAKSTEDAYYGRSRRLITRAAEQASVEFPNTLEELIPLLKTVA